MNTLNIDDIQIKSLDDAGNFSGYASIFGVVDNQNDMVIAGAFRKTLAEQGRDIKLLWQHRFDAPIGVITQLKEDARGLYIEGRLLLDVQQAKEARALVKSGAVAGLSIGYVPTHYHIDPKTGVRILEEVALYEVSFVTFPANEHATLHTIKQQEDTLIQTGELIRLSDALDAAMHVLKSPLN